MAEERKTTKQYKAIQVPIVEAGNCATLKDSMTGSSTWAFFFRTPRSEKEERERERESPGP